MAPMSKTAPKFKLGDTVKWESQASGYNALKIGKVIEVVKAGYRPKKYTEGWVRDHVSYVVEGHQADPRTQKPYHPNTKPTVYWPRVTWLQKA